LETRKIEGGGTDQKGASGEAAAVEYIEPSFVGAWARLATPEKTDLVFRGVSVVFSKYCRDQMALLREIFARSYAATGIPVELNSDEKMACCQRAGVAVEYKTVGSMLTMTTKNPCFVSVKPGWICVEENVVGNEIRIVTIEQKNRARADAPNPEKDGVAAAGNGGETGEGGQNG